MENHAVERCRDDRVGTRPTSRVAEASADVLRPSGTLVRQVRPATLEVDGFMLRSVEKVHHPCFRRLQDAEYAEMRPGVNAKNKLARKVGWGAYHGDRFVWSIRREYSLPAALNPEEGGAVRLFDPLSLTFLDHPTTQSILRSIFRSWAFEKDSAEQLYQVQLSAIRYEPTFEAPALPSPIEPHQDMVDGAIVVLARTDNIAGGKSRLYGLDHCPLVEIDLQVGDALFVRDQAVLHQVTPLLLEPGSHWHLGQRAFRDVLLVRFQAVGR